MPTLDFPLFTVEHISVVPLIETQALLWGPDDENSLSLNMHRQILCFVWLLLIQKKVLSLHTLYLLGHKL